MAEGTRLSLSSAAFFAGYGKGSPSGANPTSDNKNRFIGNYSVVIFR